jgi:hypothetical protein
MTKSHLRACTGCARHVRVSEVACPFCRAPLSEAFRASPAPLPPRARLSRAALFAFGTGTLALGPACSSSPPATSDGGVLSEPAYGGVSPIVDSGNPVMDAEYSLDAAYGGFPPFDSGPFMTEDAYGGMPIDAGQEANADAGEDAPVEIIDAAYGGPPFED